MPVFPLFLIVLIIPLIFIKLIMLFVSGVRHLAIFMFGHRLFVPYTVIYGIVAVLFFYLHVGKYAQFHVAYEIKKKELLESFHSELQNNQSYSAKLNQIYAITFAEIYNDRSLSVIPVQYTNCELKLIHQAHIPFVKPPSFYPHKFSIPQSSASPKKQNKKTKNKKTNNKTTETKIILSGYTTDHPDLFCDLVIEQPAFEFYRPLIEQAITNKSTIRFRTFSSFVISAMNDPAFFLIFSAFFLYFIVSIWLAFYREYRTTYYHSYYHLKIIRLTKALWIFIMVYVGLHLIAILTEWFKILPWTWRWLM